MTDTPELPPTDADTLHRDIMNLPCDEAKCPFPNEVLAYKYGHRDARHAAAELICATRLAAAPQGWKLVPMEPTPEMMEPMARSWCRDHDIDPDAPQPPHGEYPSWYEHCGPFAAMYRAMLDAAPAASSPSAADERAAMFDAFGEPRKRYIRLTADDSHCIDRPENLADNIGDMTPGEYTTSDVYMSEREFNDLAEFDGF